jgi:two-component system, LuxR family, response regulator FixJ
VSKTSVAQPRILLVEDDDAVRRAIQLLLRAHGYDVRAYPSGVGLARDAEALRSCCMVADLLMPQTNAIQLLREMRAAGWAGNSILISGFLERGLEAAAKAAEFDIVLPKPISDSVLLRAVAEIVARPATG